MLPSQSEIRPSRSWDIRRWTNLFQALGNGMSMSAHADRRLPSRGDQLTQLGSDDVDASSQPAHWKLARSSKPVSSSAANSQNAGCAGYCEEQRQMIKYV